MPTPGAARGREGGGRDSTKDSSSSSSDGDGHGHGDGDGDGEGDGGLAISEGRPDGRLEKRPDDQMGDQKRVRGSKLTAIDKGCKDRR